MNSTADILDNIRAKLEECEQAGDTCSTEYEKLSDDYQALAIDLLPLWDDET